MSRQSILLLLVAVIVGVALALWLRSVQPSGLSGDQSSSASSQAVEARSSQTAAARELDCEDSLDNEGDTLSDCDDPDCSGAAACRCGALSCGGSEGQTCQPEDGCICRSGECMACRLKDQTCETSADCCAGLALECQQVTLATGALEKRCLPLSRFVCNIRCAGPTGGEGVWGEPYGCATGTAPDEVGDCTELVGACDVAPVADRNVRRCWQS